MNRTWMRSSGVAFATVLAWGLAGCGDRASNDGTATLKLTSVPQAEVWVDGKAQGSTPVELAVASGGHEVVFRQVGFADHKEMLTSGGSGSQAFEATLQLKDEGDPVALGLLAQSLGVPVEAVAPVELHRGADPISDVTLVYPRSDVRKEGLSTFRVDVSPAFEGHGSLEFRKGRTVLYKQPFEPAKLVTTAEIPHEVVDALKPGDTVTWGVWVDGQKPITAAFEVVNKPQATRKLAEMENDKHVQRQEPPVRAMLKAQVLQSYRLYSEALVAFLDLRAASRDTGLPNGGIVACLRRMNLEASPLFLEAAARQASNPLPRRGAGPQIGATPTPGAGAAEGNARTSPVTPTGSDPSGQSPAAAPPTPGEAAPPAQDGASAGPVQQRPPVPGQPATPPGMKDPNAPPGPQDPNAPPGGERPTPTDPNAPVPLPDPTPPQDPQAPNHGQDPNVPPAPQQTPEAPKHGQDPNVPPAPQQTPEAPKHGQDPNVPPAPPAPQQPSHDPAPQDPNVPPLPGSGPTPPR